MRGPWGEGNGDGGVSARGSCQGGGCTAPRPCPGFPLSRERRWGRWREGFVSGWGMHRPAPLPWIPAFAGTTMGALARGASCQGVGMHRPAPLPWIPAFAGTTMGALARGVRVRVGDAPPRAPALDSRFRGNDDGGVGARGSCQGGGCTAPRPCPGFPLSRERRWGNAGRQTLLVAEGIVFPMLRVGPFRGALRTGSGRTDLGSARHAIGI